MRRRERVILTSSVALIAACTNDIGSPSRVTEPGTAGLVSELTVNHNSWTPRRPLPVARTEMGAGVGVVPNASGQPVVYLLGGMVGGTPGAQQPTTRVAAYNYSTDTWSEKKARRGSAFSNGVGVIGGNLYQSGGFDLQTGQTLATLVIYDPRQDVFSRKHDMPRRSSDGVTGVIEGRLYVLTGWSGDCGCDLKPHFYRYNPTTDSWTTLPSPVGPHLRGAAGVIGGKFYVVGGNDGFGPVSRLEVYDPAKNAWATLAPGPDGIERAAGAVRQAQLYVIGGILDTSVFVYNPATDRWRTAASLPTPQRDLAAVSFISLQGNPRILALGGADHDFVPTPANAVYTP
jgi:N-acetylneuraminic acid mutarotase